MSNGRGIAQRRVAGAALRSDVLEHGHRLERWGEEGGAPTMNAELPTVGEMRALSAAIERAIAPAGVTAAQQLVWDLSAQFKAPPGLSDPARYLRAMAAALADYPADVLQRTVALGVALTFAARLMAIRLGPAW